MRWIGTANHGYSPYAMEELRRLLEGGSFTQLAAGEVFMAECPLDKQQLHDLIAAHPPVFLRHIQPVDAELELQGNEGDLARLTTLAVQAAPIELKGKNVSVHVRKAPKADFPYSPADLRMIVDEALTATGAEIVRQQPDWIVSVYMAAGKLYIGWGTPEELLSDWPGGAIRFQKEEGQISRAKFKLLEAERVFGLDFTAYRNALDIGAAPGGWTSLLLERGLNVTAIDPAELHPSIVGNPRLSYLKRNASEVTFKPGTFDLLVCDMSWSPMQMVKLVLEMKEALAPQATAVITIKLMHRKPLQTIRDVIARFEEAFIVVRSKQLVHNREEITLFLIKK